MEEQEKMTFDPYEGFDMGEYFKYERKHAIKNMFIKGNMAWELKDDFKFIPKWFYFIKCLICLYLNRCKLPGYNYVMVIAYDEYSCYDSTSWQYVAVGSGLFRRWQVQIGTDGT